MTGQINVSLSGEQVQAIIDGLAYAAELAERTADELVSDEMFSAWSDAILTIHKAAEHILPADPGMEGLPGSQPEYAPRDLVIFDDWAWHVVEDNGPAGLIIVPVDGKVPFTVTDRSQVTRHPESPDWHATAEHNPGRTV